MPWIKTAILALSTFTRIPMPRAEWEGNEMKLAIAFLPLAGGVIGGAVWGWQILCRICGFSAVLFAVVAVALPVFITGGIHLDGFCDTMDALASRQGRERRLEILKDPHAGAFALIRLSVYILTSFGVFYELFTRGYDAGIGFCFILSRCLAAWSATTMPNARKGGMLAAFTEKADRRVVGLLLALQFTAGLAGWLFFAFPYGMAGFALCLPATLWYRGMAMKHFGGVTGDTTGYYLQTLELTLLAGLLLGGVIGEWL